MTVTREVSACIDQMMRSSPKALINDQYMFEWLELEEAIRPADTMYGTWPDMTDRQWHQDGSSRYTFFEYKNIIFSIQVTGQDLSFGTISLNQAKATLVGSNDPAKIKKVASSAAGSNPIDPRQSILMYGKVLFVVVEYLNRFKPQQLDFSGFDKLSSLYSRGLRQPHMIDMFDKIGYHYEVVDEIEVAEKPLIFFTLTRK